MHVQHTWVHATMLLSVCMHVRVHVRMYVCMYVCMHVHTYMRKLLTRTLLSRLRTFHTCVTLAENCHYINTLYAYTHTYIHTYINTYMSRLRTRTFLSPENLCIYAKLANYINTLYTYIHTYTHTWQGYLRGHSPRQCKFHICATLA